MTRTMITLRTPGWLESLEGGSKQAFTDVEERMDFVIGLSRKNIDVGAGGPFGAAVFNRDEGTLLSCGVNLVLDGRCSMLHAEIVAIIRAQIKTGTHDLSAHGLPPFELVTSTEPCVMCFGAVTWSGIKRLVCGARREDAEETGFDEGEKPLNWKEALENRGVEVQRDVLRDEAASVLKEYRKRGGRIYNPQRS